MYANVTMTAVARFFPFITPFSLISTTTSLLDEDEDDAEEEVGTGWYAMFDGDDEFAAWDTRFRAPGWESNQNRKCQIHIHMRVWTWACTHEPENDIEDDEDDEDDESTIIDSFSS